MRTSSISLALLTLSCASIHSPLTEVELRERPSAGAWVASLSQPDASRAICDGTQLGFDTATFDGVVDGLVSGAIPPAMWEACIDLSVGHLLPEASATLYDAMAAGYESLLRNSRLEVEPALQARLGVMHRLYLERPFGLGPHEVVIQPKLEAVRAALSKKALGPVATRFAQEIVDTTQLEQHSMWLGAPVTAQTIDAEGDQGNSLALTRFALRLSGPELREQARRRLIRIQMVLSPSPRPSTSGARAGQVAPEGAMGTEARMAGQAPRVFVR